MKTKTKLTALTAATLIAFASIPANAASFSDTVFSWPTDYRSQKETSATSTFDGKTKALKVKKPAQNKTQTPKRK